MLKNKIAELNELKQKVAQLIEEINEFENPEEVDFAQIESCTLLMAYKDNEDCAFDDTHVVIVSTNQGEFVVDVIGADEPILYAPNMSYPCKQLLFTGLREFLKEVTETHSGLPNFSSDEKSHNWGERYEF